MAQMYPDFFFFFLVPLPTQRLFIYLGSAITQKWNKQKRESNFSRIQRGDECTRAHWAVQV